MLLFICLVSLLVVPCPGLPAPQDDDYDGTDYGDYDADSKTVAAQPADGLGDILMVGSGIAQALMQIISNKVQFFARLLSDKELQQSLGQTLGAGLNISGGVVRAVVPLAQGFMAAVPAAVEVASSPEVQERAGQVAGAGARVAQGVGAAAAQVPVLVGQGSRLVGSVIRAANDTVPLILTGISEFTDQLPLIAGFASAYAEVNAEQTQKVVSTFQRSLSCSLECQDITDTQARAECEEKFCKEMEEEDDYDYSI